MADRSSARQWDEIRTLRFSQGITHPSQQSVLTEFGNTKVLCGVSVVDKVPHFLRGSGNGWLTAEYSMLPLSTNERVNRDRFKQNGRSIEIQRLIGRSLRAMVDLSLLGERTIMVDCDVLSADGGTRTAAITGASVALQCILNRLIEKEGVPEAALKFGLAAVSAGIVDGQSLVDLEYVEDSRADADLNLVMNDQNEWIEVQGSSENAPFSHEQFLDVLAVGQKGVRHILEAQNQFLAERF